MAEPVAAEFTSWTLIQASRGACGSQVVKAGLELARPTMSTLFHEFRS